MLRAVFLLIFSLVLAAPGFAQPTPANILAFDDVRIFGGDDPQFADPAFDDADWPQMSAFNADPQGRLIWVRARVDGDELKALSENGPPGFFLSALASREVYFNGVSIGTTGTPGATPADETPGALDAVYALPPALIQDGDNIIAIRTSSHHLGARVGWPVHTFHVSLFADPTEHRRGTYMPAIAAGGAIGLGAFYFLGLFAFNRKDVASLSLGILALAVIGQLAAEAWRAFDLYLYPAHMPRLYTMLAFAGVAGVALASFATLRFAPHRARIILIIAGVLAVLAVLFVPGYDPKIALVILVFMAAAMTAAIMGAFQKKRGAVLAALGFAAFFTTAFLMPIRFLDQIYYVAMAALIIVLFATQIRLLSIERRTGAEAALQAVRLRHELLKKQIQPHFIMNTLTTLSEWIESEPKTGIKMIDALSEEFRLLYDISEKKLISLHEETELCKRHLEIMSLRADATFTLASDIANDEIETPPAVILTLIENAFTHNEYRSDATFDLSAKAAGKEIELQFACPIADNGKTDSNNGAGLAYIRARLKEAFGDEWSLTSDADGDKWRTIITWRAQ